METWIHRGMKAWRQGDMVLSTNEVSLKDLLLIRINATMILKHFPEYCAVISETVRKQHHVFCCDTSKQYTQV